MQCPQAPRGGVGGGHLDDYFQGACILVPATFRCAATSGMIIHLEAAMSMSFCHRNRTNTIPACTHRSTPTIVITTAINTPKKSGTTTHNVSPSSRRPTKLSPQPCTRPPIHHEHHQQTLTLTRCHHQRTPTYQSTVITVTIPNAINTAIFDTTDAQPNHGNNASTHPHNLLTDSTT